MTNYTRKVLFEKADGNIFEDITWPSGLERSEKNIPEAFRTLSPFD
jgi:hypothetical protein